MRLQHRLGEMGDRAAAYRMVWIILVIAISACQGPPAVSPTASSPTPEWGAIPTRPRVTPTATVAPAPATATVPLEPTADLPSDFTPHPALHRVAPPTEQGWLGSSMHWDDDTHLRYRVRYGRDETSGCFTQTWAVHTVFEETRLISDTTCFPEGTKAAPTPTIAVELSSRDIEMRRRSPDRSWEFILAQTSAPDASLPKIGHDDPASDASLYQGWLVNVSRGEAHAIFYTSEIFGYLWAPDSRRLIVVGDTCYGGGPDVVLGSGLYTIDVQNHTLHTISSDYVTGCEGSLAYAVARAAKGAWRMRWHRMANT